MHTIIPCKTYTKFKKDHLQIPGGVVHKRCILAESVAMTPWKKGNTKVMSPRFSSKRLEEKICHNFAKRFKG